MEDIDSQIRELQQKKRELLSVAEEKIYDGHEKEAEKLIDKAYDIDTTIYNLRHSKQ